MICTFSRLFPLQISDVTCGGDFVTIEDLHQVNCEETLKSLSCNGVNSHFTIANLILNKVTPDQLIQVEKLYSIDICSNHRKVLTLKHKSARQKSCGVKNCNKQGEKGRLRATFEDSKIIYDNHGFHVLVGSALCSVHRKLVRTLQVKKFTDGSSEPNSLVKNMPSQPALCNIGADSSSWLSQEENFSSLTGVCNVSCDDGSKLSTTTADQSVQVCSQELMSPVLMKRKCFDMASKQIPYIFNNELRGSSDGEESQHLISQGSNYSAESYDSREVIDEMKEVLKFGSKL